MKKVKSLSLVIAVILVWSTVCSFTAFANKQDIFNGFSYNQIDSDTVEITSYCGNDSTVKIPSKIYGDTVVSIGKNAFKGNNTMQNVSIPVGVNKIGYQSFNECTNLLSVEIPSTVTQIGKAAFFNCTRMTSVTFSENLKSIGDGAFYFCVNLKSITLPNSLEDVGEYAFGHCEKLKTATINSQLTQIPNQMFYHCDALNDVKLPDSIENIGSKAFSYTSIDNPDIPQNVKTIGDEAFQNCSNLKSIALPDSLKELCKNTFKNDNLTYIFIPKNVEKISPLSFSWCCLENIIVDENNEYYKDIDGVLFDKNGTKLVFYPSDKNQDSSYTVPNGVTTIGDFAFSHSSVDNVRLPNSLTTIDDNAFNEQFSLNEISIPNSVTYIGKSAFEGCSNLSSIDLPSSISTIEENTFKSCNSLENIDIPDGITTIKDGAFGSNYCLNSISIPSTVKSMTANSIASNVNKISISPNNDYFSEENGAIYNKDKTKFVYLYNDNNQTQYNINDNINSIGEDAFSYCNSVKCVSIPKSVILLEKMSVGYNKNSDRTNLRDDFYILSENNIAQDFANENNIAFFTTKPKLNNNNLSMKSSQTFKLQVDGADVDTVSFTSGNNEIATVNQNGLVKSYKKGTTTIIASIGTKNLVCNVTVTTDDKTNGKLNDYINPKDYMTFDENNYKSWIDDYYKFNKDISFNTLDNYCTYCYSSEEYVPIMGALVGGSYQDETVKEYGQDFGQYKIIADNLKFELNKYKLNQNVVLYSGTNKISNITGTTSSVKDMKASIGKTYTDKGVISTSIEHATTERFGIGTDHTVLEIYAPKSVTNGGYISKISYSSDEYELLLNADQTYKIIDAGVRQCKYKDFANTYTRDVTERYMSLLIVDNDTDNNKTDNKLNNNNNDNKSTVNKKDIKSPKTGNTLF